MTSLRTPNISIASPTYFDQRSASRTSAPRGVSTLCML
jgi:hypothetical protein